MNIFSQWDSSWAYDKMGTKEKTIGQIGCYLTCMAQLLANRGYDHNPQTLNKHITDKHLYIQGNNLSASILSNLFPSFKKEKDIFYGFKDADLSLLNKEDNEEIILCLDFDHDPSDGMDTHFVVLAGYDGKKIIVDDPYYGTRNDFTEHYGNNPKQTILKIIKYKYTIESRPVEATIEGERFCAFQRIDDGKTFIELRQSHEAAGNHVFWGQGKVSITPIPLKLVKKIHTLTDVKEVK